MTTEHTPVDGKVALITGSARRIGAYTARTLHTAGMNLCLHYHYSAEQAQGLADELNAARPDSVQVLKADLRQIDGHTHLISDAMRPWGRLDLLVNNASSFYPTPIGSITEQDWDDLMGSNLKAPLFLSQAAAEPLKASAGCIINIIDIHAERPMRRHTVYSIAKAGLLALTKSLARELGPEVRINGIAPGAILWPEHETLSTKSRQDILDRTALKRAGDPADIANTVLFLFRDAPYITGHMLPVDGGRLLNI